MSTINNNPSVKSALTIAGYVLAAAAGVTGIVVGILQGKPGFIVIGVAFLAALAIAFFARSSASPRGSLPPNPEYGGKVTPPDKAWYIAAAVLVVGLIVGGLMLAL